MSVDPTSPAELQRAQQMFQQMLAEMVQAEAAEDMNDLLNQMMNPLMFMRRFRPLEERTMEALEEVPEVVEEKETLLTLKEAEEAAKRLEDQNEELHAKTLMILRSRLSEQDTAEDILKRVLEAYADFSLADEALEFLARASPSEALRERVKEARSDFRADYEREIKAGRNIGVQAREFSKAGLGSPTSLRDLYRDITGNPREPLKLFDELSQRFNYEKLRQTITFLLHSLGQDLKSKGPSISRGELTRLIDETRSLQGILGIYRFFQSRMKLIFQQFAIYDLAYPKRLTFEELAKGFVKLLAERYIIPEKVLQSARQLGIMGQIVPQIILFGQMRDAVKQIAPRYYRNKQHKDELFESFVKAIEQLEEEQEKEEEEEDE